MIKFSNENHPDKSHLEDIGVRLHKERVLEVIAKTEFPGKSGGIFLQHQILDDIYRGSP